MIDRVHFRKKYFIPSTRLPGYDYSSCGVYAVTFCTKNRECFLSTITNGRITLLEPGKVVLDCWNALPDHFQTCELDTIVILPNHVHLILQIRDETGQRPVSTIRHSLGSIIGALKSYSSKRIHELWHSDAPVWQSRFYEHIIRSENSYDRIKEYFVSNPENWTRDHENPIHPDFSKSA